MEKYHFKEAFNAGLIGGFLLLVLQMVLLPLLGQSDAYEFPSVMANLVVNSTAPDIAIYMVGIILPIIITVLLSLSLGWVPSTWHPWALIPVGLTFGTIVFVMYFLFFISIKSQLSGIFNMWHVFAFMAYGIVIALAYHKQVRKNYKPDNPLYRGYANE